MFIYAYTYRWYFNKSIFTYLSYLQIIPTLKWTTTTPNVTLYPPKTAPEVTANLTGFRELACSGGSEANLESDEISDISESTQRSCFCFPIITQDEINGVTWDPYKWSYYKKGVHSGKLTWLAGTSTMNEDSCVCQWWKLPSLKLT